MQSTLLFCWENNCAAQRDIEGHPTPLTLEPPVLIANPSYLFPFFPLGAGRFLSSLDLCPLEDN